MTQAKSATARRRGALFAAALIIPMVAMATPAAATPRDYSRADGNYAGSQIALHEKSVPGARVDAAATGQTIGHDVSGRQGAVDWAAATGAGARFAYVKATEGNGYTNPRYTEQYNGSHTAGMIRGAYHFALPDVSGGAEQAQYFIDHGGAWRHDGTTLPGALDIEYNPYGDACYGKSTADMTAWIKDFTKTYLAKMHRSALIYTSTSWWKLCTANNNGFGNTNPLWLARYAPAPGELPAGWEKQAIWQFADSGGLPGDQNYYNGPFTRVQALANG